MKKSDGALPQNREDNDLETVPLFGSWRKAYFAVVIFFAFDVAVFYAIRCHFS